jgi:ParB family chromosome partitioning protein
MPRKVLGRGLEALIPSPRESVKLVEVSKIVPNKRQPRKDFDKDKLNSLVESIKEEGLLQPIVVRESGDGYEIIFGERRWRAAREAGLENVPVMIKEIDDEAHQLQLALVENLQREELNPIERAAGYRALIADFNLSQEEVAQIVGKQRSSVANTLRLLKLPQSVQNGVVKGNITEGHARTLLSLPKEESKKLYKKLKNKKFSVREAERIARRRKRPKSKDANIEYIEEQLQRKFGTKVFLKTGRQRGSITIEYYTNDDLNRILEILGVEI